MKDLLDYANVYYEKFNIIKKEIEDQFPININQIEKYKKKYPDFPITELLNLIDLQQKAFSKIPFSKKWFFSNKNMQQASHYKIAIYHSKIFQRFNTIADLCSGIGSDLLYLSKNKSKCYAIDYDELILEMCKFNMSLFERANIFYKNMLAENFVDEVEAIFLDPDRRQSNRRLIRFEDLSPNFQSIKNLFEKYDNVAIKLSPLFDFESSLYKDFSFDFVSLNGELKECLLKTGCLRGKNKAVLLSTNIILEQENHQETDIKDINYWLLEPDPAIIRSHLVNDLAYTLKVNRVDYNISLLTSRTRPDNRYGKIYEVIDTFDYNLKSLNSYLIKKNIGIIDIKTKGFSESIENFRKKLTLKGNEKGLIFIIRKSKKHICIVAKEV